MTFKIKDGVRVFDKLVIDDQSNVFSTRSLVQSTENSSSPTTGALVVSGGVGIAGNLHVGGDLVINGSTTTISSTVVAIDDPVFALGGDTPSEIDDSKDRGIEFRWHDGNAPKLGFFGHDDSRQGFAYIPDATNQNEVFSGELGDFFGRDFYATGGFYQLGDSGEPLSKNFSTRQEISSINLTTIHTWDISVYRSAKYLIQISQGTNHQVSELIVVHNGVAVFFTEYAAIETTVVLGNISAIITGGAVNLQIQLLNSTSAIVRTSGVLLPI